MILQLVNPSGVIWLDKLDKAGASGGGFGEYEQRFAVPHQPNALLPSILLLNQYQALEHGRSQCARAKVHPDQQRLNDAQMLRKQSENRKKVYRALTVTFSWLHPSKVQMLWRKR